jgi:hypothetical protein
MAGRREGHLLRVARNSCYTCSRNCWSNWTGAGRSFRSTSSSHHRRPVLASPAALRLVGSSLWPPHRQTSITSQISVNEKDVGPTSDSSSNFVPGYRRLTAILIRVWPLVPPPAPRADQSSRSARARLPRVPRPSYALMIAITSTEAAGSRPALTVVWLATRILGPLARTPRCETILCPLRTHEVYFVFRHSKGHEGARVHPFHGARRRFERGSFLAPGKTRSRGHDW